MYARCEAVKALFAADNGHDINDPRKVIQQGLLPVREMVARRIQLFGLRTEAKSGIIIDAQADALRAPGDLA